MKKKNAIIFDLHNVLFSFDPTRTKPEEQFNQINDGVTLLKKCHAAIDENGERFNKLFILSNLSTGSFEILQKIYPDIINLFDGAVISGKVKWRKPNIQIYKHLLQKYTLDPSSCIFIDDKDVNVLVALSTGIHGIVYDDPKKVEKQLKDLCVL